MSFETALHTLIAGELAEDLPGAIADAVKQVSARPIGADVSLPHVSFEVVSDPESYEHPDRWRRVRVTTKALSFDDCEAIDAVVHDALDNLQDTVGGVAFDHIQCIDRGRDPEFDIEMRRFEKYSDYRVCTHE